MLVSMCWWRRNKCFFFLVFYSNVISLNVSFRRGKVLSRRKSEYFSIKYRPMDDDDENTAWEREKRSWSAVSCTRLRRRTESGGWRFSRLNDFRAEGQKKQKTKITDAMYYALRSNYPRIIGYNWYRNRSPSHVCRRRTSVRAMKKKI